MNDHDLGPIDLAIRRAIRDVVRQELELAFDRELARRPAEAAGRSVTAEYLSVNDAAKLIRVHPATIRAWMRDGALPRHRAGRHYRVKRSELEALSSAAPSADFDLEHRARQLSNA